MANGIERGKEKISRAGAAAVFLFSGALILAPDQGAKSVNAESVSPTPALPTATRTPTPDATATKIAQDMAAAERRLEEFRKLATITAIAKQIEQLQSAPTPPPSPRVIEVTPTPSPDVVVIPRKEFNALIDKMASIAVEAERTAIARQPTPTPRVIERERIVERETCGGAGGSILGFLLGGILTFGATMVAMRRNQRFRAWVNAMAGQGGQQAQP